MKNQIPAYFSNDIYNSSGRLESWILLFTIVGYPIVAAISQIFGFENRPLSIVMRGILLGVAILLFARFFTTPFHRKTLSFWFVWWFFWILYISRLVLDVFLYPEALKLPASEYLFFSVGVCLIPSVAASFGNVNAGALRSINILLFLMVIGLVLNVSYGIFGISANADIALEGLRVETETLNPIAIGHLGASVLLLTLWKANEEIRLSIVKISILILFASIAIVAIISSGSRGPMVALVISTVVYATIMPRHFLSPITILLPICFLIFAIYNLDNLMSTFFINRISDHLFVDDIRTRLLREAFDAIISNPLTGSGIDPLETYPHNLIVESFVVFGVLSGLTFCYVVTYALVSMKKIARDNSRNFWVCILFVQYFVGAMFSGSIYFSNIFWVLLVLTVSLSGFSQGGFILPAQQRSGKCIH